MLLSGGAHTCVGLVLHGGVAPIGFAVFRRDRLSSLLGVIATADSVLLADAVQPLPAMTSQGRGWHLGASRWRGHTIPDVYGALQPTAVFVPLDQVLSAEHWEAVTTEVFGPFQVRHAKALLAVASVGAGPNRLLAC